MEYNAALSLIAISVMSTSALAQFGANLVRNPSFEEFEMVPGGLLGVEGLGLGYELTQWQADGVLILDRYDGSYAPTTGHPAGGGSYYLIGGRTASTTLTQSIDLSFAASSISTGDAWYSFGSFLGSFKYIDPRDINQEDIATITVRFKNGAGDVLGSTSLVGPNIPSDVGAPEVEGTFFGLLHANGFVPIGSSGAEVIVDLVRDDDDAFPTAVNNAAIELPRLIILPSSCRADLNGDGNLDFFDLSAFVNAYESVEPIADLTEDGSFDFFDISAFLTAFGVGCP